MNRFSLFLRLLHTKSENMDKTIIKALAKRIFSRKREKDYIPVYLKRFASVDRLIETGMLAIDLDKKFVALDTSIHLLHMNDIRKYSAFFDTVRAYMNYRLGLLGMPGVKYSDRIDFTVMLKQTAYIDADTGELYDNPKETYHPLVIGYYTDGQTVYAPYGSDSQGSRAGQ